MKKKQTVEGVLNYADSKTNIAEKIGELALSLPLDDLSDSKRKFVAVMLLPESMSWTNLQKASEIGIRSSTFYEYLKDEKLKKVIKDQSKSLYGHRIADIVKKHIEIALAGDRQAIERILEETGVLAKSGGDTNINIGINNNLKETREKNWAIAQDRLKNVITSDN